MNQKDNQKKFSLIKRAKSFTFAGRGIWFFFRSTHNAWLEVVAFILAIILGFYFGITKIEWLALILAGGFVLSAEAFNTAIEIDMDFTSPDEHPLARDTKDVAAGAVLVAAITAALVGIVIFAPYILVVLRK